MGLVYRIFQNKYAQNRVKLWKKKTHRNNSASMICAKQHRVVLFQIGVQFNIQELIPVTECLLIKPHIHA